MVKFGFEIEEIEEGKARIIVPKAERGKGPGKREGFPFYNPVMVVNRDISVLVLQRVVKGRPLLALDGLSGTGIRGLRFALEVDGDLSIVLNDWNEMCYELILENIKKNGTENAHAKQEDLNHLLDGGSYHYVDVDPFGTPIHFLDSALQSVMNKGILAVTATDTAALAGSYPNACRRKYDADPLPISTRHEIGLRILIGHCARTAANHELGVRPLLSHSTDHYYRTYLEIVEGQSAMNTSLDDMGFYSWNPTTFENVLERERKEDLHVAGPLWIGGLWDGEFLENLRPRLYMSAKTSKTLELIKSESKIEFPFYSSDELASRLGVLTPKIKRISELMTENGLEFSPTHFDPKGFRTNAPIEDIKNIFKNI
jgi:tRNA (guanine26-N2/guanine27-N2)-dimethyltransferase